MKIGTANIVTISSYNKDSVIEMSLKFCQDNGYQQWRDIYKEFDLFRFKWKYKIDLIKPLDFEIKGNQIIIKK